MEVTEIGAPFDTLIEQPGATLLVQQLRCGDVNIVLTPYDVLRLKRRLGIYSTELLQRYSVRPFTKEQQLPVVLLRMQDDQPGKPCPFVTPQGCGVYEDRPWPCRMYPVGVASARTQRDATDLFDHSTTTALADFSAASIASS